MRNATITTFKSMNKIYIFVCCRGFFLYIQYLIRAYYVSDLSSLKYILQHIIECIDKSMFFLFIYRCYVQISG